MRFLKSVCSLGLSQLIFFSITLVVVFFLLSLAQLELKEEKSFFRSLQEIAVSSPPGKPPIRQESIDIAITIYNIKIPVTAEYPQFDPKLEDRGLTIRSGWWEKALVSIGPPAFSSWGLLGSTIAHEIEVHCEQSFFMINLMDSLSLKGTSFAEREAYLFELTNVERFNLSPKELAMINDTMSYFYPEEPQISDYKFGLNKYWLAKSLFGVR